MNTFVSVLTEHNCDRSLKRGWLTTLQVNMGNLCNQSCAHCHIEASPGGTKIMAREVIDDILIFLSQNKLKTLDITGGAPELNPHFDYFIATARPMIEEVIVRSNLTVIFEPGKEYLPEFYRDNSIHLVCSLPCYREENVDVQRGSGVFQKSLKALKLLNDLGFAKKEDLMLDLVYNPVGASLPPEQEALQKQYKENLKSRFNIEFNNLFTITNVPIKRFKEYLDSIGEYEKYFDLLKENFNPYVLDNLMCRSFLSVGYDGLLYDCDFNQALGLAIKDKEENVLTIDKLCPEDIKEKEIILGKHCLSCTAGCGSSCQGALVGPDQADETSLADAKLNDARTKESVKSYYGKILSGTADLKSNACCTSESLEPHIKKILSNLEPEILTKFYGCGSPIPPAIKGCVVLDLGCGTGRDVYAASCLVGEEGMVIGVDMTPEQLEVARKYKDIQMIRFGMKKCNVDFRSGLIEDLRSVFIEDGSVDVVISNCVINLSTDKKQVFREIFRVLKPGGEVYFSDIFSGRRVPRSIKDDPVLYGECLGGALYIEDFRRIMAEAGCPDYRVVSKKRVEPNTPELKAKTGMIDFYSMTVRAFKLNGLEDICEDYGQTAMYLGTIPGHPENFLLDDHHVFISNKRELVCGNTALMLAATRYAEHFVVEGNRKNHFGPFNCSPVSSKLEAKENLGGGCC